ncbi:Thrombospondin, type 1 repeat-containing protein [Strongyloides ratti]|uniref:Thrombospondin, type 1 repeat-containing protein n=1 Tax=Strongyloides ratti TaxID=34506 RepID=A0A090KRJ4_STRRB|nr:Thrombospondin, type 1 repeat-containing protein [Strongyloides ratti]CEF60010.1 Thrombospondin, type 1 repeat-containing protein [Strongyloides ratti]
MYLYNYFKILLPFILWLIIISNVLIFVTCDDTTSPELSNTEVISPKLKVIRRLRNLLTDFLTEEQCIYFIDTYLKMYNDGATFQEIQEDVMTNAMDHLDDEQLLAALGAYKKANKALGSEKLMTLGMTCIEVLKNNLTPFMNQVTEKMKLMKEENKGTNAINNNIFLMMNQFFTRKRCRTIFKRIMKKIGKEDFDLAYPFLNSFLKFDLISDLIEINLMEKRLILILLLLCLFYTSILSSILLSLSSSSSNQQYLTNCGNAQTEWLEWSSWGECTDKCGSCGIHMRTRICLTTNSTCACPGSGTQLDYCNLNVCLYPRQTCCYNKIAQSFQGKFTCLTVQSG